MDESNFSYVHIEKILPSIGKWVKNKYMEQFGTEPLKLPHKINTNSGFINTGVYYYPSPWLKALFKVH
tara:strand:- start:95 stop:298 length:204 start_codon:yes stop_codon:yes gene_type:complete